MQPGWLRRRYKSTKESKLNGSFNIFRVIIPGCIAVWIRAQVHGQPAKPASPSNGKYRRFYRGSISPEGIPQIPGVSACKHGVLVLWESSFSLLIFTGFWITGGFKLVLWNHRRVEPVAGFCRSFVHRHTVAGLHGAAITFQYYSTFVIEERFGFNKTTRRTFILDLIKRILLRGDIGGTDFSRCACLIQYAGEFAWLYCWAAVVVFSWLCNMYPNLG